MFQNVSKLVHMTPMNQRSRTKRLRHRFVQRLRAVEDDQETAIGAEATTLEIGQQTLTDGSILGGAVPEAERMFGAGGVDAERDHDAVVADVDAVDQQR